MEAQLPSMDRAGSRYGGVAGLSSSDHGDHPRVHIGPLTDAPASASLITDPIAPHDHAIEQSSDSIAVSQDAITFADVGETITLVATVFDAAENVITDAPVVWTIANPAVATVDQSGLVTAVGDGTTRIAVTAGPVTVKVSVLVDTDGGTTIIVESDRAALVKLYKATGGDQWDQHTNWLSGRTLDAWHGVSTNAQGHVTSLLLGTNNLVGQIPSELGTLPELAGLDLSSNSLSGTIPAALGDLGSLEMLDLSDNAVAGSIPAALLSLPLTTFGWDGNDGLCMPNTAEFVAWTGTMRAHTGDGYCNKDDRDALEALYTALGGAGWTDSQNWVDAEVVSSWFGITTNTLGVVTAIALPDNGVNGELPASIGDLAGLVELDLSTNTQLTGPIPVTMPRLDALDAFRYGGTGLCVPVVAAVENWLSSLTVHDGTGVQCVSEGDRATLESLYTALSGAGWTNDGSWLTNAPIDEWYGVTADDEGRVTALDLSNNGLEGALPAEIAQLALLTDLSLDGNGLAGPIPEELGSLGDLERLSINSASLSGSLPAELGDLSSLTSLSLEGNSLSGALPSELGDLMALETLDVSGNDISGVIPAELGDLGSLAMLDLSDNAVTGSIPAALLSLPLTTFGWDGNDGLCMPNTAEYVAWTETMSAHTGGGYCNKDDRDALEAMYAVVGGSSWTNSQNWMQAEVISTWFGITTDALGRVTAIALSNNGLIGKLPASVGDLASLVELDLSTNMQLTGPIPEALTGLDALDAFRYAGTELCVPRAGAVENWLVALTVHNGTGVRCPSEGDRDALEGLYTALSGAGWTNDANWLTSAPLNEWDGVTADDEGRITELDLSNNGLDGALPAGIALLAHLTDLNLADNSLSGTIPSELGNLDKLKVLDISDNGLTGSIPTAFLPRASGRDRSGQRDDLAGTLPGLSLTTFAWDGNDGLCMPNTVEFVAWSGAMNVQAGDDYCNKDDRENLEALYTALGGASWTDRQNWRQGEVVSSWSGITTDALGRVTAIALSNNGLVGELPTSTGDLANLVALDLSTNAQLTGPIPITMPRLDALDNFNYGGTGLCIPRVTAVESWLASLAVHNGTGVRCASAGDRDALESLYTALSGAGWTNKGKWLTDAPINEWYGVTANDEGRVTELDLSGNGLAGALPAGIAALAHLTDLNLDDNTLTGPIPEEVGTLDDLESLSINSASLSGSLPEELGDLTSLTSLRLEGNSLSGAIPSELGDLDNLTELDLSDNEVTGSLPTALLSLSLTTFAWDGNDGVCMPNTAQFVTWVAAITSHTGDDYCNKDDRENLEALYTALGGAGWTNKGNWGQSAAVSTWFGITTDALGRVTAIDLSDNGLAGELPASMGNLASLVALDLSTNAGLTGGIPETMTSLDALDEFRYNGTELCIPRVTVVERWLFALTVHNGTGVRCPSGTDREALESLYTALSGASWTNKGKWLTNAPIDEWYGVTANADGRVTELDLSGNGLAGALPAGIAALAHLTDLNLDDNTLTGTIPEEVGTLDDLESLSINSATLSGSVPEELGNLTSLTSLSLEGNSLSGAIPSKLGDLNNLTELDLSDNEVTGSIPTALLSLSLTTFAWDGNDGVCMPNTAQFVTWVAAMTSHTGDDYCNKDDRENLEALYTALGGASWTDKQNWRQGEVVSSWAGITTDALGLVTAIDLSDNGLAGELPASMGNLGSLVALDLSTNTGLTGAIPEALTSLDALDEFRYNGTGLCVPSVQAVADWLAALTTHSGTGVQCSDNSDRPALGSLYSALSGANWTNKGKWLTSAPIGEWFGITTDALGGVTAIDLSDNGLVGELPASMGNFASLVALDLSTNVGLTGGIPETMTSLDALVEFRYNGTELCVPRVPVLQTWLFGLAVHNSTGVRCHSGTDREALEYMHYAWSGADWTNDAHWLTDEPIDDWYGVTANDDGRVTELDLSSNGLDGELWQMRNLAQLTDLNLEGNSLSGAIFSDLGDLDNLTELDLSDNEVTGSIPTALLSLPLTTFAWDGNDELCMPNTSQFITWVDAMTSHTGDDYCNKDDREVLEAFYAAVGGAGWTDRGNWGQTAVVATWFGITTDGLGRVRAIELSDNGLAGELPVSMGNLANLVALDLSTNAGLTGAIPEALTSLDALDDFSYVGTGLCVPSVQAVADWLAALTTHSGTGVECPDNSDRPALESLYSALSGASWTNRGKWLTDAPINEWYGVTANADGQVTALDLSGNSLAGELPASVGNFASLVELDLSTNAGLTGAIPEALTSLDALDDFSYVGTGLCVPSVQAVADWLAALTTHSGTGVECPDNSDRPALESLYSALSGADWTNKGKWLTDAPIDEWYGVTANADGQVTALDLSGNGLDGALPAEIADLALLTDLNLDDNTLQGPIPEELGTLGDLESLSIDSASLSGNLPKDLGDLTSIETMMLAGNDLTGPIPSELGSLSSLSELNLNGNKLTGELPSELGSLSNLVKFSVTNNSGLTGEIPASFVRLTKLTHFQATGTSVCLPAATSSLLRWEKGLTVSELAKCPPEGNIAIMFQAVQSFTNPTPLVAGEKALLRVLPTINGPLSSSVRLPRAIAKFYLNNQLAHTIQIPQRTRFIPNRVWEQGLPLSLNAVVPASVVQPGLEIVIEVDPDDTVPTSLGVAKRIPETGRQSVNVVTVPSFDITYVPFLTIGDPDMYAVSIPEAIAADPYGHIGLFATRYLFPIKDITVTVLNPVTIDTKDALYVYGRVKAMRAAASGTGHWMGILTEPEGAGGLGELGGYASMASPGTTVMAHEFGHNFGLLHAPCGASAWLDPYYPYNGGLIGNWGYNFSTPNYMVDPRGSHDLMTYCSYKWISDYNYNKVFDRRTSSADPISGEKPLVSMSSKTSLLLWGGMDSALKPYLNPIFVIDEARSLPQAPGPWKLAGHAENGNELFSLNFSMPVVADGDGSSSFAFAVPAQSEWDDLLVSVTLSGPSGSFTLDGEHDTPMAIVIDETSGQITGFIDNYAPSDGGTISAMNAISKNAGSADQRVLISNGIPDSDAWNEYMPR